MSSPNVLAELEVRLSARLDELESRLGQAKAKAKKEGAEAGRSYGREFAQNVAKSLNNLGNTLTMGVTLPIIAAMGKAMHAASALEEQQAGVEQTFKSSSEAIKEFGKNSAESYGLATSEAYKYASSLGGIFKASGLAEKAASEMSVSVLKLGADLASFKDIGVDDALLKLRAGLVGEIEPLRQVGVLLSEAAVKAKATQLGFKFVSGELSENQKVMARYAVIMDQLGDAHGDFKRTQDSVANQTRIVKAEFENLSADLGKELLPIGRDLLKMMRDWMRSFNELDDGTKSLVIKLGLVAAAAGPILKAIGLTISAANVLAGAWSRVAAAATAAKVAQAGAAGAGAAAGGAAAAGVGGGILARLGGAMTAFNPLALVAAITAAPGMTGGFDPRTGNFAATPAGQFRNAIQGMYAKDPNSAFKYLFDQTGGFNAAKPGTQQAEIRKWAFAPGGDNPKWKEFLSAYTDWVNASRKAGSGGLSISDPGNTLTGGASKKSGGGGRSGRGSTVAPDVDLTSDLLLKMARTIDTPKGSASCAVFVSKLLAQFTDGITDKGGKIIASAKGLRDRVVSMGGQLVGQGEAKVGDLVVFNGPNFGARQANGRRSGYHVGSYLGDGRFVDSSGGVDARVHNLSSYERATNSKAQFYSLPGKAMAGFDQTQNDQYNRFLSQVLSAKEKILAVNVKTAEQQFLLNDMMGEYVGLTDQQKGLLYEMAREYDHVERTARAAEELRQKEADRLAERARLFANAREDSNQLIATLVAQLGLEKKLTYEQQVRAGISKAPDAFSPLEKGLRIGLGRLADQQVAQQVAEEAKARFAAFQKNFMLIGGTLVPREWVTSQIKAINDRREQLRLEATERYEDSLQGLAERVSLVGSVSEATEYKMRQLALVFGVGETAGERMANGMNRARRVIEETLKVEKLEEQRQTLLRMAATVEEAFMGMFDNLLNNGFSGLFSGIMNGFRNMLAQMAREWIASQVRSAVTGFLGNAIGGLFGGGGGGGSYSGVHSAMSGIFGGMRASGGPVRQGLTYMVGERGPELFVPDRSGTIVPNNKLGGGVTVVVNVNATDANSFMRSEGQVAESVGRAISKAVRRNG